MTKVSANGALVMNVFCPFRTKLSPSRRAVVRIDPNASEPAPGSVMPHAPIFSHRENRQRPSLLLLRACPWP